MAHRKTVGYYFVTIVGGFGNVLSLISSAPCRRGVSYFQHDIRSCFCSKLVSKGTRSTCSLSLTT